MAGIAVWMAVWWIFEALPLAVTALLPIVLYPTFGIMGTKDIAPSYMNDIIFLFIGGFLLAFAIEQWQLHKRIASRIMNLTGQSPARIILGIMLTTFLLSMWISNTATTIMMIAPATAIIASLDLGKNDVGKRKFAIALLLGIAYSASLGGMATLIGTPPNLIFAKQYEIAFPDAAPISFSQWFIFAFPVSLIFLFIVYQLLHFRYFRRLPSARLNSSNLSALKTIKASYEEKVVLIAFVLLAILFFFRADILIGNFRIPGWSSLFANPGFFKDGTIAIAVALILFIIPSKSEKQTHILSWRQGSRIPFNIILLFGGGFALAKGFSDTGLSVWVGNQVQGLSCFYLLLFFICLYKPDDDISDRGDFQYSHSANYFTGISSYCNWYGHPGTLSDDSGNSFGIMCFYAARSYTTKCHHFRDKACDNERNGANRPMAQFDWSRANLADDVFFRKSGFWPLSLRWKIFDRPG